MIVLNKKKYEIEETVQVNKIEDDKTITLYEFKMQITGDDLNKINSSLFNEETIKSQKQIERLKLEKKYDEIDKLEEEIGNKTLQKEEELKKIIFKEHLEKVREFTNEYEFNKLYGEILGFFINAFVKERIQPLNTTITDLQKITQN
jgi:hypothetical protein